MLFVHNQVRLRIGMYSEYLEDWMSVFPMKQLMVVKFEDYVRNRTEVLEEIFHFLGLGK